MPNHRRGVDRVANRVIYGWDLRERKIEIPRGYLPCPRCTWAFRLKKELQDHCAEAHQSTDNEFAAFAVGEDRVIGFDLIELSEISVSEQQRSRYYAENNDHDILYLCRDTCAKYGNGNDDSGEPYFLFFCGNRKRFLHDLHCAVFSIFTKFYPKK